jgi:hypothetical protein
VGFAYEGAFLIQRTAIARYLPQPVRFLTQRDVEMSQGTLEFNGGHVFDLTGVNRALAQLARPGSTEEWLLPLSRADLVGLGVFAAGRPPLRHELIERLWSRKRRLQRRAAKYDGWGPEFPVA